MQINARSLFFIVALAFMASALAGCLTMEQHQKVRSKAAAYSRPEQFTESMVSGEWIIAVDPTSGVMVRLQFGTKTSSILKAGADQQEINTVMKAFSQKEYDEAKTSWKEALNNPDLQWRLVLNSDHSGQHIGTDMESNKPYTNAVRWELLGPELRLVYPDARHFNTFSCRLVSRHELHYPMQPLGGWFVMRRQ